MLFLVSQSTGRTPAIAEVTREFSLFLKVFESSDDLSRLAKADVRRIAYLAGTDIRPDVIEALLGEVAKKPPGVIVCANREVLRSTGKGDLIEQLDGYENTQWIADQEDIGSLRQATRVCWQRMLRISQEEMRRAIDNREFIIQYQPKVERSEGREWTTREAESLLRWRHPDYGIIGPLEFLPEAEAFGMMGEITEHVLEEAAVQLARWHEKGLELNSCINLAPSLLCDPSVSERFESIVRKHGQDCSRFTFEVTESDVANTEAPHLKVLQTFRKRGFRVSLDDFGVAASSLSAFEQLPFDEIKIHASALQRAKSNPVAQQVLAAVTGLAHNLGISVCAEGVEDQETFEFLKTIECDKMQGFLISEAVMPDIIRRAYDTSGDVEEVA
jgi:EAL domain-containing protein (putative c-di-GMP-specific phosphodiesterase class I)